MEALLAAVGISLISLIGIFFFRAKKEPSLAYSSFLPISIGAFLGVTFLELLPEAFEQTEYASWAIAGGFLGFFLLSRLLHEYHHHKADGCEDHPHRSRGTLILFGDAVHNFSDGIVIAIAFSISPALGIATTIGIALHEIPQEIAEFFVLLHAGYSRKKALMYNFFSALSVVLGTLVTLFFIDQVSGIVGILVAIAAGNLLYIAASDLLPDLIHGDRKTPSFFKQFLLVVLGFALISTLLTVVHEGGEHGHEENIALHDE